MSRTAGGSTSAIGAAINCLARAMLALQLALASVGDRAERQQVEDGSCEGNDGGVVEHGSKFGPSATKNAYKNASVGDFGYSDSTLNNLCDAGPPFSSYLLDIQGRKSCSPYNASGCCC